MRGRLSNWNIVTHRHIRRLEVPPRRPSDRKYNVEDSYVKDSYAGETERDRRSREAGRVSEHRSWLVEAGSLRAEKGLL